MDGALFTTETTGIDLLFSEIAIDSVALPELDETFDNVIKLNGGCSAPEFNEAVIGILNVNEESVQVVGLNEDSVQVVGLNEAGAPVLGILANDFPVVEADEDSFSVEGLNQEPTPLVDINDCAAKITGLNSNPASVVILEVASPLSNLVVPPGLVNEKVTWPVDTLYGSGFVLIRTQPPKLATRGVKLNDSSTDAVAKKEPEQLGFNDLVEERTPLQEQVPEKHDLKNSAKSDDHFCWIQPSLKYCIDESVGIIYNSDDELKDDTNAQSNTPNDNDSDLKAEVLDDLASAEPTFDVPLMNEECEGYQPLDTFLGANLEISAMTAPVAGCSSSMNTSDKGILGMDPEEVFQLKGDVLDAWDDALANQEGDTPGSANPIAGGEVESLTVGEPTLSQAFIKKLDEKIRQQKASNRKGQYVQANRGSFSRCGLEFRRNDFGSYKKRTNNTPRRPSLTIVLNKSFSRPNETSRVETCTQMAVGKRISIKASQSRPPVKIDATRSTASGRAKYIPPSATFRKKDGKRIALENELMKKRLQAVKPSKEITVNFSGKQKK